MLATTALAKGVAGTNRADTLFGTARADAISGLGGNDTISGLGGSDRINGNRGSDTIVGDGVDSRGKPAGRPGNDVIVGRSGNEIITGCKDDDTLTGAGGNDTFVYSRSWGIGHDMITDFGDVAGNQDVIRMEDGLFTNFGALQAAMTQVGSDVVIAIDTANTIKLLGVSLASMTQDDFVFA